MKLQLTAGSVRLRLAEAEVAEFARTGRLAHTLHVGPNQDFSFVLLQLPATDPAPALAARYAAGELTLAVPEALARTWADGPNISLKGEVVGTDGQTIRLLVEKDLGPSH